jgi:uncharacterized protein YndB with AHSA1/START domain
MEKLHFSIVINAPKEKVWNAMLKEYPYRAWTQVFGPGSHYVGDWGEGSKILFLAPDEDGQMSGMIGRIKENRTNEFVSVEYIGVVESGKEDTSSEEAKKVAGALESYTFKDIDGKTELLVDIDAHEGDELVEMFRELWPKALQRLKRLVEKRYGSI